MRQTVSTVSTRDHESNLDALLEDLQATVSRSNSLRGLNGSNVSGYREIRRTVKDDATGESSTEYKIEYLHPANTTMHVSESSNYNSGGYGTAGRRTPGYNEMSSYKYSTSEKKSVGGGSWEDRLRPTICELDTRIGSDNYRSNQSNNQLAIANHSTSMDSGLLDSGGSLGRMEERVSREERREVRGPRRELVFTGTGRSREPSPGLYDKPIRQEMYRYEKTTTTRTIGDMGSPGNESPSTMRRSRSEETRGALRSPSPHYRDHSPGDSYRYRDNEGFSSDSSKMVQTSYSSSSNTNRHHESSRSEAPRSPPPHRSPSPVSFIQPPPPAPLRTSLKQFSSSTTTEERSGGRPQSPNFYNPPPNSQHHSSTYNYSSTTSNRYTNGPMKPAPFPNPPGEQQPPKKIDELMASFADADLTDNHRSSETTRVHVRSEGGRHRNQDNSINVPIEREVEKTSVEKSDKKDHTKNITGPPVYYPKGGELFVKKEESVIQGGKSSGGGKYKAKSKYEYESGSKYRESSDTKVVPVCVPCPCCCAAPCTIM